MMLYVLIVRFHRSHYNNQFKTTNIVDIFVSNSVKYPFHNIWVKSELRNMIFIKFFLI